MNTPNSTEDFRHQCEVRWCLTMGIEWFQRYAKDVAKRRGPVAAQRLWKDFKAQGAAGNSGAPGEWIDQQIA